MNDGLETYLVQLNKPFYNFRNMGEELRHSRRMALIEETRCDIRNIWKAIYDNTNN